MKMEQLENGCLKIFLDDTDMQEMGLRFEDMRRPIRRPGLTPRTVCSSRCFPWIKGV